MKTKNGSRSSVSCVSGRDKIVINGKHNPFQLVNYQEGLNANAINHRIFHPAIPVTFLRKDHSGPFSLCSGFDHFWWRNGSKLTTVLNSQNVSFAVHHFRDENCMVSESAVNISNVGVER
jgi:hypothetical protein